MTPTGNTGTYQYQPPPLYTGSFSSMSPTGESTSTSATGATQVSPYYTPPNTNNPATASNVELIQQAIKQNQKQQQDTDAAQQSPIGISPMTGGKIAGKLINGGFTDQLAKLDNFGSSYLGLGSGAQSIDAITGSGLSAADTTFLSQAQGAAGLPTALTDGGSGMAAASGGGLGSEGFLGTTTSFSSMLGSAGIGALGGGLLAHLTGGNVTNGSIGGAIGGAVGSLAMGTELGAALGSLIPIPGLGTILGGAVGGLIGGAFGPGKPTNASGYSAMLTENGALGTPNITSKNPNQTSTSLTQTAGTTFSGMAQDVGKQLGIKFNPNIAYSDSYSSKHGGSAMWVNGVNGLNGGSGAINYNPDDAASTQSAYIQTLTSAAKISGATDDQISKIAGIVQNYKPAGAMSTTYTPPASPIIPVNNSTFSQFMSKQGTSNGSTNGSGTTPTV